MTRKLPQQIKSIDPKILTGVEVMLSGVREIPDHLESAPELVRGIADQLKAREESEVRRVILCGLGGSAFPGDLLQVALQPLNISFMISRYYEIQHTVLTSHDLVIASSFSGNTEESISSLEHALRSKAQVLVICAGGRMRQIAHAQDVPLIRLTKPTPTFQPRAATGFFIGALSALLEDLNLFSGARVRMQKVAQALRGMMEVKGEAQEIALQLQGKIPVFYAPPPYANSLARVAKIKINENAKCPAFWNEIPEFNHNEMVGYTHNHQPFTAVFFTDPKALPRMKTRVKESISTLSSHGVSTLEVPIREADDPLTAILATLYLFDVVSCELAVMSGVDPNPVAMVEDFKESLGPFDGAHRP